MFYKLLKGTGAGLIAHQSNRLIEEWETRVNPPWTRLARYSVGMLAVLPVGLMIFNHLYRHGMDEEETADVYVVSTIAASVCFAVGVAAGYLIDGLLERLK